MAAYHASGFTQYRPIQGSVYRLSLVCNTMSESGFASGRTGIWFWLSIEAPHVLPEQLLQLWMYGLFGSMSHTCHPTNYEGRESNNTSRCGSFLHQPLHRSYGCAQTCREAKTRRSERSRSDRFWLLRLLSIPYYFIPLRAWNSNYNIAILRQMQGRAWLLPTME